jgi:hypothetical protein
VCFHFDSFGGGMNMGCNIAHIADVVSAIMPEIVLFPPPHKLKTVAHSQTHENRNNISERQLHLPTRNDRLL